MKIADVFYWILNMSINAVICALLILIIRAFKKIPRRYIVFLWIVPFFRMAFPISLSSDFSLMKLVLRFTSKKVTFYESQFEYVCMNHLMQAETYFPITYKTEKAEAFFSACGYVWIFISLALFLYFFIVYYSTKNEINKTIWLKDNVYVSVNIKTPAVYGILKPKIIIPQNLDKNSLEYILLHENMHIKSFDNFFRAVAIFLVCFHWFNPFSFLFLKLFHSDVELACDERVLMRLSEKGRNEYAKTLLYALERNPFFVSPFGGSKIKKRINNIVSFKKLTLFSSLCFILLIGGMIYFLLTNA